MPNNEVWGLDIGKSALKAIKMRRIKDQVEIIDIDLISYEQPQEGTELDRDEQIRKALIDFQIRHKVKNEPIYASIPGQATFNRIITIPPVEDKRIREIVTYEAQQQIPFPINEVIWDYQLIGGKEKEPGEEREAMLFAVRREIINNFLNNLATAQLNIKGIQIAPLAVYNFIRYERPDLSPCVAIDIGAENTDLIVVDGDKLWLRAALPAAGNEITKAIQKRFNLTYDKAEELKLKAGKSQQASKIFEVMKPILKEIIGEINRSVGYYKSTGSKEIKFQRMIFMGNVTKLTGFDKFFSQTLQDQVEILSEVHNIGVSPKINVNLFQTNIPSFAVAMGLAIQGLGLGINKIRLLPKEWVDEELVRNQKMFLAIAVAILVIVPVWIWYVKKQAMSQNQELADEIQLALEPLHKKQTELDKAKSHGEYQNVLGSLTKLGTKREIWIALLEQSNQVLLNTSEIIKKENEQLRTTSGARLLPKIWILDQDTDLKVDSIKLKNGTFQEIPYLTFSFSIVFESLGDEVQSRNYALKYIQTPLHNIQISNQPLFDTKYSICSKPEMRETLFPNDPRGPQTSDSGHLIQYCQINMQFVVWLELLPLDIEQSIAEDADFSIGSEEWNSLVQKAQEKQFSFSEEVQLIPIISSLAWQLKDTNKGYNWMIYRTDNILKIYSIRS